MASEPTDTAISGNQAMILSASYNTPDDSFRLESRTFTPPSSSPADKQAYLARLRTSVSQIQGDVNRELTQRMEADKARAAAAPGGKNEVDEVKEEENYGEEVPENDD